MDRMTLLQIDEELGSSEVAALCFLCRDVVNRKRLEGISDAKGLFMRLEEKGLLENNLFLSQLLETIQRPDLLSLMETDNSQSEETDACPLLSNYRVMLYNIYEDITQENLNKMKFLLHDKLGRARTEKCDTALDVFAEMEKIGLLSNTNVDELHRVLMELDRQLASTVQRYKGDLSQQHQSRPPFDVSVDYQSSQPPLPIYQTPPRYEGERVHSDADPNIAPSLRDQADYYTLNHIPRGVCMIINNELFPGSGLGKRGGTNEDMKALQTVFTQFGFAVDVHNNLTAEAMRQEIKKLGGRHFFGDDALVVCVLSHGQNGTVYGSDGKEVFIRELTEPFTSNQAPTLAGKPKLFFIQACQGNEYQRGSKPSSSREEEGEGDTQNRLEADAGPFHGETVASDADFLLGMATVPRCKSFRNTSTGSIYIQELCRQLKQSAESSEEDDILTVLTRVNREVGKGDYKSHKQMPEPKYTLTKKLVFKVQLSQDALAKKKALKDKKTVAGAINPVEMFDHLFSH